MVKGAEILAGETDLDWLAGAGGDALRAIEAAQVLGDVPGVEMVRFTERDVVRHELVQKIILAYERHAAPGRNGAAPLAGSACEGRMR